MRTQLAELFRKRGSAMNTRGMVNLLALACILLLAGCTTGSGNGAPQIEDAACVKACDAAMDKCSIECEDRVDDNLCSQECIDRLDSCKKTCE